MVYESYNTSTGCLVSCGLGVVRAGWDQTGFGLFVCGCIKTLSARFMHLWVCADDFGWLCGLFFVVLALEESLFDASVKCEDENPPSLTTYEEFATVFSILYFVPVSVLFCGCCVDSLGVFYCVPTHLPFHRLQPRT